MTVDAGAGPIDERAVVAVQANDAEGKPDQQEQHQQDAEEQQEGQRQQSSFASLVSSRSVCRICHTDSWAKEPLISPCRCKGTLAHVHLSCLERWLNQSCRNYCELCNFRYNAQETPRYRWYESLRIWINHPRNRSHIKADALMFALLTLFTTGLSSVCFLGSKYFVLEGMRVGFSESWTRGAITLFMTIVIFGYLASVYLLIMNQVTPWYRWWRGTVNIRLLDTSTAPAEQEEELELEVQPWRGNDLEADERR